MNTEPFKQHHAPGHEPPPESGPQTAHTKMSPVDAALQWANLRSGGITYEKAQELAKVLNACGARGTYPDDNALQLLADEVIRLREFLDKLEQLQTDWNNRAAKSKLREAEATRDKQETMAWIQNVRASTYDKCALELREIAALRASASPRAPLPPARP